MDIMDISMSMFFPSELSSPSTSTPSAAAAGYPHNLLGVDSTQDELLLMHHQQMHLQQLQQHQQQQLQYEIDQIGLGTPPTSPLNSNLAKKGDQAPNMMNLHNSLRGASHSSIPQYHNIYQPLHQQPQSQNGTTTSSSYLQEASFKNSTSFVAQDSFDDTNFNSASSPTIPLDMIKREISSPSTPSITNPERFHSRIYSDDFTCGGQNQAGSILSSSPLRTNNLPVSPSPFTPIRDYDESMYSSSPSSTSTSAVSDHAESQEYEPTFPHSPYSSGLKDFSSTGTQHAPAHHVPGSRPRSMITISSSFPSPSFSTLPYDSLYYKESLSTPTSPSLGPTESYHRHDRRRSSSGSFSASDPDIPASSDYGASHHHYQGSSPDQSQPVQYHPQQQHLQHLLDPSQVPEIKDVHVCPVCQRRFTRPFNLRSHIMTHTTARPFPCDECHWKFTRQHDLLRHKRAKHPGSVAALSPKCSTPKDNSM